MGSDVLVAVKVLKLKRRDTVSPLVDLLVAVVLQNLLDGYCYPAAVLRYQPL